MRVRVRVRVSVRARARGMSDLRGRSPGSRVPPRASSCRKDEQMAAHGALLHG